MEREAFLARTRQRLGRVPGQAVEPAPSETPRLPRLGDAEKLALFVRRLEDLGVVVARCDTVDDARRAVEALCAARGWSVVACAPADRWAGADVTWTAESHDAELGLCAARWGIAQTGTVVLCHRGEARRSYSLLPRASGFLVHADDLVDSVGDVLGALGRASEPLPAAVTFVSGPSTTADIASVRCVGVHGPAEIYVWIVSARRP